MSEEQREKEEIRQAKAEAGAGKVIPGSGRRGTPRRMAQMVSVRLDGELIGRLKTVARQRGLTLSELLREGAECVVRETPAPRTTVRITTTVGARLHEVAPAPGEELLSYRY